MKNLLKIKHHGDSEGFGFGDGSGKGDGCGRIYETFISY